MGGGEESGGVVAVKARAEKRRVFTGGGKHLNRIPAEIADDPRLAEAVKRLPNNYNFEIAKTVWRIRESGARRVGLQMPEGLAMFAVGLCDILAELAGVEETVILGDVTYGACCVDDLTAKALGVELLVHYGHSCLIPIDRTDGIAVLYVFVDIKIDGVHLVDSVKSNFGRDLRIGLASTIQYLATVHAAASELGRCGYTVVLARAKPLSPGELLGCTAPVIPEADLFVYVGDGRFHLEAAMIANPNLKAYRYDPFSKKLTEEFYGHDLMMSRRREAVVRGSAAGTFGLILGTLGRQGSTNVMKHFQEELKSKNKDYVLVLLSEIFPSKLRQFPQIDCWIQIACPRLSIDWGCQFSKPVLTPYEGSVALGHCRWTDRDYPMDFYSTKSRGPWTPNFAKSQICSTGRCDK